LNFLDYIDVYFIISTIICLSHFPAAKEKLGVGDVSKHEFLGSILAKRSKKKS
jgi:hypothetical protein